MTGSSTMTGCVSCRSRQILRMSSGTRRVSQPRRRSSGPTHTWRLSHDVQGQSSSPSITHSQAGLPILFCLILDFSEHRHRNWKIGNWVRDFPFWPRTARRILNAGALLLPRSLQGLPAGTIATQRSQRPAPARRDSADGLRRLHRYAPSLPAHAQARARAPSETRLQKLTLLFESPPGKQAQAHRK